MPTKRDRGSPRSLLLLSTVELRGLRPVEPRPEGALRSAPLPSALHGDPVGSALRIAPSGRGSTAACACPHRIERQANRVPFTLVLSLRRSVASSSPQPLRTSCVPKSYTCSCA